MSLPYLEPLFNRRVPQILGAYLGCSWGVVEFVSLLVDRYVLSPYLVDFSLVLLALFIPSVCLLAWFHGQPGDDEWTLTEAAGLSVNGIGSLIVLFLLFGAKDLGSATTTVSVTDEKGKEVKKEIPKSEFRKELALFYFENESGDSGLDWARYGLPIALEADLNQDLFIRVHSGFSEELSQKGFKNGTGVPLSLKQEVAGKARRAHFLSGTLHSSDSLVKVRTELRETETAELVKARTYSGPTIFDVVDQISVQLRQDLEVPSAHLEQVKDLPVAELTTGSLEAFRAYAKGYAARVVRDDVDAAREALENAVALDSTFALAHWRLSAMYGQQNRGAKAKEALAGAMEHLYKLPQRYRFEVKDNFYSLNQQPDKQLSVAEMRVEFYPEDVEAHLHLADLYQDRNRNEDALDEYQRVLEIDPSRHQYHDAIGDIYREMGRYEEARASYLEYAEHFPEDPDPFHEMGLLFQRTGKLDSAATYFEKAHLLKPENVDYLLHLARLGTYRGNFETAAQRYEEALTTATTPSTRMQALSAQLDHYQLRGQIRKALPVREKLLSTAAASGGLVQVLEYRTETASLYAEIGKGKKALRILDSVAQKAQPPLDRLVPLGRVEVHRIMENVDALEKLLPKVQAVITDFGIQTFQWAVELMRGEIHRFRDECEKALPLYEEALSYNPDLSAKAQIRVMKARCHRSRGQLEDARAEVRKALRKIPIYPEALREKALVHRERGEREQAVAALEEALRVYEPADSSHVKAQRARALHDELTGRRTAMRP